MAMNFWSNCTLISKSVSMCLDVGDEFLLTTMTTAQSKKCYLMLHKMR